MHSGHAQMCSIGFYCLVLLAPYLKVLGFLEKLAFSFCVYRTSEISRSQCSLAEFQGTEVLPLKCCSEVEATISFQRKRIEVFQKNKQKTTNKQTKQNKKPPTFNYYFLIGSE